MYKGSIDYKSYRWVFFSSLAGSLNQDLEEARLAKSWAKRDPAWKDLQQAVRQLYLDPIVQAVADMTGESFSQVRKIALERAREVASAHVERNLSIMVSGGRGGRLVYSARDSADEFVAALNEQSLFDVDPLLFAWVVVNAVISHSEKWKKLGGRSLGSKESEASARYLLERQRALASTFSMTEKAARDKTEIISNSLINRKLDKGLLLHSTTTLAMTASIIRSEGMISPAMHRLEIPEGTPRSRANKWLAESVTSSLLLISRPIQLQISDRAMFSEEDFLGPLESITAYPPTPRAVSSGVLGGSSAGRMALGAIVGAAATFAASKLRR